MKNNAFENIPDSFLAKWQEIADLIARIMNIPAALIMKTEDELMEVFVSSQTENNPYKPGDKEHWHGLYCETVIKTQQKLCIPNALKDKKWAKNPDIKLGMIAYLGFPINFPDQRPFGTLCVLDNKERAFSDEDEKLLLQFKKAIELDMALIFSLELDENHSNYDVIQKLIDSNEEYQAINEEYLATNEELKQACDELVEAKGKAEENEMKFRLMYENSSTGMAVISLDFKIAAANSTYCEMLGYSEEELIGKTLNDITHPESLEKNIELQTQLKNGAIPSYQFEKKFIHKDGHPVYGLLSATIIKNREGEPLYFLGNVQDITKRKQAESEMLQYEWITEKSAFGFFESSRQSYGDVSRYNKSRVIQDGVGKQTLADMANDVMALLDTSIAVYEANGDYAYGAFESGWCRFMDEASFNLCGTNDFREALNCGKWLCHENCWNDSARVAMNSGKPADIDCVGGIKLYAVPVFANNEVIGCVNIGYGNPPKDDETLQHLSEKYNTPFDELKKKAFHYKPRPDFIIELGKKRTEFMARLIGEIIERKSAEEALQTSEEKYRRIAENVTDIVWITDLEMNPIYVSPSVERVLGITPEDYLKRPISETYPPASVEKFQKILTEQLAKEKDPEVDRNRAFKLEAERYYADGTIGWDAMSATFLRDENMNPVAIQGVSRDITERVKTEEALQKKNEEYELINKELQQINDELLEAKEKAEESDRLKSAFLANMSHEIRTPMNGILGFAELLKEPELTGDQQQNYISVIEESGARMLSIINDIVDISKIEAGLNKLDIRETNINELIEYIYTFFKPEVEAKGMVLSFKNSLPLKESIIYTDREKVYAILANFVKNAIKYSNEGEIEIGYLKKGEWLEFYVQDTGVGIPKERQEAIFERFMQADIDDKMARQGAGLGLSISKAYVEMLGGKIWVESEEGVGSTFYFSLPLDTEHQSRVPQKDSISEGADHSQTSGVKGLKILIAEDDEASKILLQERLKTVGKEFLEAGTGVEAVEVCRGHPDTDLVLVDIQMPEMDGYEATRQIRQFNQDVVIISQTAYGLSGDREKSIEAGCDDYIAKPINKDKLLALIEKHFQK
ncbi:MAG: PAS domain S-box protein [Marinilabiliaceae bacterium]